MRREILDKALFAILQRSLVRDLDEFHSTTRSAPDRDVSFAAAELLGDESDQFGIRLSIDRRGFQLRQPDAIRSFYQRRLAGIRFHTNLQCWHDFKTRCFKS